MSTVILTFMGKHQGESGVVQLAESIEKGGWVDTQLPDCSRILKLFDWNVGYMVLTASSAGPFFVKGTQVELLIFAPKIDENPPFSISQFTVVSPKHCYEQLDPHHFCVLCTIDLERFFNAE